MTVRLVPAHIGPLEDIVADGVELTVTTFDAVAEQPLAAVTVTVYVPPVVKVFTAVAGVLPPDQL